MHITKYPSGEVCDLIMLTKTMDDETYKMTLNAIDSLKKSENSNKFRVILVESNKVSQYKYPVDVTLFYTEENFNYNKALNMAFKNVVNDYVCVSNNDVVFMPQWYSLLRYYMDIFNLDSASPKCPRPQAGVNTELLRQILNFPDSMVVVGYEALLHLAGWCWVMKKDTLREMLPFPEDLIFWFQDNHMGKVLHSLGKKHGLVTQSHVIHFGQQSYKYIPEDKQKSMTVDLQQVFINKWVSKPRGLFFKFDNPTVQ